MPNSSEKLVMFLGSGFSANLGLPVTSRLQDRILEVGTSEGAERLREEFISKTIAEFWKEVFGWDSSRPSPALEEHFTQIDMAANSGHCLGKNYGPKRLRALRRMTIHRVFRLLDVEPDPALYIDPLVAQLNAAFELSIITTNWDIMAERCLERNGITFHYTRQAERRSGHHPTGMAVCKLHGSGNWGYCDLCQSLIAAEISLGKIALHYGWLLEREDFRLFSGGQEISRNLGSRFRDCLSCGGPVAVRVATFSFRKHFDVPFFQTIWDEARERLQSADRWLFVGYSLPEAEVEIRHLLKATELARKDSARPRIDVVLKEDCAAALRYERFFGRSISAVDNLGVAHWVNAHLPPYIRALDGATVERQHHARR